MPIWKICVCVVVVDYVQSGGKKKKTEKINVWQDMEMKNDEMRSY